MRVLIFAIGSAGDVHPFIGVARALQARGHEVIMIAGALFEDAVRRSGLEFRPLGTAADFQRLRDNPDLWHPTRAFPTIVRDAVNPSYAPIYDYARELNRPGETVMVGSSLAFGARNAQERLGIPLVGVHLAPSLFPSVHRQPQIHGLQLSQRAPRFLKRFQWTIAGWVSDGLLLPELNRFRRGLGLSPARRMIADWWHAPDRVIALFPPWFAPPQPDWPPQTRLTGFPLFDEAAIRELPPELEEFLAAGEPPVIFTPGSAMVHGHRFFAEALAALKLSGRRGILLSPYLQAIPQDLPPQVRHFSYIPFSQVLPRAAALVYHGGVGTCAQTLRAGIPHLIQPMAHDQFDNLSRVRDLGVGDGLPVPRFKAPAVAAMLDRLTGDPALKARAREIAGRFDPAGWLRETCELIEAAVVQPAG